MKELETINQLEHLAAELGAILQEKYWVLALAESCTGGMVAQAVTSVAGSSAWFDRGFVTYSNQAKIEMLGVSPETLEKFGAVSEEIAKEMALGALKFSHADIAGSITGIAGPDGGSAEKPVGMVCFAWAGIDRPLITATHRFAGNRQAVRQKAAITCLQGILSLTLNTEL